MPRGPVHARLGPRPPRDCRAAAASSCPDAIRPTVAAAPTVDEEELKACLGAPSPVHSPLGIDDAGSHATPPLCVIDAGSQEHSVLATAQLRTAPEDVAPACSRADDHSAGQVEVELPVGLTPGQPSGAAKPLKVYVRRRRRSKGTSSGDQVQGLQRITKPVDQLLPRPALLKKKAEKNVPPSVPRRSRRIAGAKPCSPGPVVTAAQRKVIQGLGLSNGKEVIDQRAQDDYSKLFEQPLTDVDRAALAAILGWQSDVGESRGWELLVGF